MKEPNCWNSLFALQVIVEYEHGRIDGTVDSIRKWHDKYNEPNGTSESDINDVRKILEYYNAGHSLSQRPALERVLRIKQKAENIYRST